MFDQLCQARASALAQGEMPSKWRFSPEGWDKARANANALHYLNVHPHGRIESVMGLPYSIDTSLPAEIDFMLDTNESEARKRPAFARSVGLPSVK